MLVFDVDGLESVLDQTFSFCLCLLLSVENADVGNHVGVGVAFTLADRVRRQLLGPGDFHEIRVQLRSIERL